ncbi:uncharacterized protein CELE_F56D6.21 [Caenorhabditis elegans]|uniref:Uncharacterized protein n=1 Tax=Caenorhabditis elegans TaxID=6239 RepID=U4PC76_CAEEL|nr:Uncharacterized protein CELE_F56D6.21 [Caenorhabditis elegans]CDH93467.1 Uncharacterized protein CELE_F56D6.21 [Caenorhabditis elegans]|eukprot:NP_001294640.1 Uncharacterized protein CELE_F56D6.21 [Caenorhabditis elegans]
MMIIPQLVCLSMIFILETSQAPDAAALQKTFNNSSAQMKANFDKNAAESKENFEKKKDEMEKDFNKTKEENEKKAKEDKKKAEGFIESILAFGVGTIVLTVLLCVGGSLAAGLVTYFIIRGRKRDKEIEAEIVAASTMGTVGAATTGGEK